ncbi:MAG: LuxR family transcriptional regulator [Actinomycetia bacterium]|nr:LuxR family transcriptional regulator [Actinomycetes bacterium]
MMPEWPFTGRLRALDRIRAELRTGPGVVIAGPAGVGKTRLAAEAVRDMEPVLHVGATRATAQVPLGAFAGLLPAEPAAARSLNLLRWATEELRLRAGPGELVLAVDDGHLLDPVSAALVHHLVLHGHARLLATIRSGEPVPDPVLALWKEGLTPRLELGPLPPGATREVLEGALGGQLDTATVERLWQVTRGNLLFLRELVLAVTAEGLLARVHGVWRWWGELPVTPRLRELVEIRLGAVDAGEREVLEYVALGEPLGAYTLIRLTSANAVERAEEKHLIELARSGRRLEVRLAHPLYGEVARDRAGPGLVRTRMAELAEAVEAQGLKRAEDLLRGAVWRLESETTVDGGASVAASLRAKSAYDLTLAERLGRAALAAGGGIDAAIALAGVLLLTERAAEGGEILASLTGQAGTDRDRARAATTWVFGLAMSPDARTTALEILTAAEATITGPAELQELLCMRGRVHTQLGELPAARDAVRRARELGEPNARVAAYAASVETAVAAYGGRLDACLTQVAGVLDRPAGWRDETADTYPELDMLCARMLALLFSGDPVAAASAVDDVISRLDARFRTWDLGIAGFLGHRGQIQRMRGAVRDAERSCREGMARLASGPTGFAGLCLGELAHSAALLGDLETAEVALAGAQARTLPTFYLIDFPGRLARPWVLALRGELPAAVAAALSAADEAAARGVHSYEMLALHDVVRLGAADLAADRLELLADWMDGPLIRTCARHARAAADLDGPVLDAVAQEFAAFGMTLHAAEAAAQAAPAHEQAGQARNARAARVRAWILAQRCQGARTPALAGLAAPALTPRQYEIVGLAATGLGNREIADRLVLSTRTVANHLVAAYHRLGVSDRTALAALLSAAGPPVSGF